MNGSEKDEMIQLTRYYMMRTLQSRFGHIKVKWHNWHNGVTHKLSESYRTGVKNPED